MSMNSSPQIRCNTKLHRKCSPLNVEILPIRSQREKLLSKCCIKDDTRYALPKQRRDNDIRIDYYPDHSDFDFDFAMRSALALASSASISSSDRLPSSFCIASRSRLTAWARISSASIMLAILASVIGTPSALACSSNSSGSLIVISTSLMILVPVHYVDHTIKAHTYFLTNYTPNLI